MSLTFAPPKPNTIVDKGTLAARPANGGAAGHLYYITDAGAQRWTRWSGLAWEDIPENVAQLLGLPVTVSQGGTGGTTLATGAYLKGAGTAAVTTQAVPIPVADGGAGNTNLGKANVAFNYTFNGDFEIWGGGTATTPTGWTAAGAGAAYAKNTTAGQFKITATSLQITPGGAAAGQAFQDVDLIAGFGPAAFWQGKTVTVGMWVRATAAAQARIRIDDGVANTASADHSGNSAFTFLTATRTLDAAATRVRVIAEVSAAGAAAQFDGAILVLGSSLTDFVPSGWQGRKAIIPVGGSKGFAPAAGSTNFFMTQRDEVAEGNATAQVPFKGVARNLTFQTGGSPGAGQTYTLTIRRNFADTALVAIISGASTQGSDTVDEVQFAKLDQISFRIVTSATASVVNGFNGYLEYEEVP